MLNKLLWILIFIPFFSISQVNVTGKVIDAITKEPLPFATVKADCGSFALTSSKGVFVIRCDEYPVLIKASYLGYNTGEMSVQDKNPIVISLDHEEQKLESVALDVSQGVAKNLIKKAMESKGVNDPQKVLKHYSYKSYNKFKITSDESASFDVQDTSQVEIEHIFNDAHSFLSEKVSLFQYSKGQGEKETVLATRMTGFSKPIYDVLGITVQSNSLYRDDYVVFENKYAGPLSNKALRSYHYKILDVTQGSRPAYVVLFQPRKSRQSANLEGVLYLDVKTLAIQKAVAEVRGELNIMVVHEYEYRDNEKIWFPKSQKITIRPGLGKEKVTLFGGQISVGRLGGDKNNNLNNNDFLSSSTDFFEFNPKPAIGPRLKQAAIEIDATANTRSEDYWQRYRTSEITKKDQKSFKVVDSIVDAQNIERRIDVIKHFNIGYYPVGFFNFDLTYPIKYNNYEGLRLGIGGHTNNKLSRYFRLEGYSVYGFLDEAIKYGVGGGVLFHKGTETWLNVNYSDDIREVGSFFYLTDKRVYSLFEPRLVNIDFYYKHKTWSTSLQHRVLPGLIAETQLSVSDISQTGGYRYNLNTVEKSSYQTTEGVLALRWSPFSKYLKTPDGFKEIYEGYPKITAQVSQGFEGVLDGELSYSKIGLKAAHVINRLNQSQTSILLEASVASGDLPLTHLYHAFPNAPRRETVLQRFSVAGRRGFETMFFSEFFSDRLASLQLRHRLRPFKLTNWMRPELVLISRFAIGDVSNRQNHLGVSFGSLEHGYQESGFEINKLFTGFGLSFAYRYGAYHLPEFADNLAFKFTFYLKL